MRAVALAACLFITVGCGDGGGSGREIMASVTATGQAAQPDAMFKLDFSVTIVEADTNVTTPVVDIVIAGRANVRLTAGAGGVYTGTTMGLAAAFDVSIDGAVSAHVELPAKPTITMMLLPNALQVDWTPPLLAVATCLSTPDLSEQCQQSVSPGSATFAMARTGLNTVKLSFSKASTENENVTTSNLLVVTSSITR